MKQLLEQWKKQTFDSKGKKLSMLVEAMVEKSDHLLAFASTQLGKNSPPPDKLFCELMLALVGPTDATSVPKVVIDDILTIVNNINSTSPKHYKNSYSLTANIVIAIGCGWKKDVSSKWPSPWSEVYWNRVYDPFSDLVAAGFWNTVKFVNKYVIPSIAENQWLGEVISVALQIIDGKCDCVTKLRSEKDANNIEDKCSNPKHNLAYWDPGVCSLQHFVTNAVKGWHKIRDEKKPQGSGGFLIGSFSSSIGFATLKDCCGLAIVKKLYRLCHVKECKDKYYGLTCKSCKTDFNVLKTKQSINDKWLLLIEHYPEPISVWCCSNKSCNNHFLSHSNVCPHCDNRSKAELKKKKPTKREIAENLALLDVSREIPVEFWKCKNEECQRTYARVPDICPLCKTKEPEREKNYVYL